MRSPSGRAGRAQGTAGYAARVLFSSLVKLGPAEARSGRTSIDVELADDGESTALHLAGRSAKVVLAAHRVDRLEKLVADIRASGGQAIAVATDVAKRGDMERLAAAAVEAFGRVDVLVNNAGVMPRSPLAKLKVDEWDRATDVNIKGVLYGIAAVLPLMQAQGSGHIINIASGSHPLGAAPFGRVAALPCEPPLPTVCGRRPGQLGGCEPLPCGHTLAARLAARPSRP